MSDLLSEAVAYQPVHWSFLPGTILTLFVNFSVTERIVASAQIADLWDCLIEVSNWCMEWHARSLSLV